MKAIEKALEWLEMAKISIECRNIMLTHSCIEQAKENLLQAQKEAFYADLVNRPIEHKPYSTFKEATHETRSTTKGS